MDAFCRSCGSLLREGQPFCSKCGAPVPAARRDDVLDAHAPSRGRRSWSYALAGVVVALALAAIVVGVRAGISDIPTTSTAEASPGTLTIMPTPSWAPSDAYAAPSPTAAASTSPPSRSATGEGTPGFLIRTRTVTDLAAAAPFTYQTIDTAGFSAVAASVAKDRLDALTDPRLASWASIPASACEDIGLTAPCGNWKQTATATACIEPYVCVLVEGSGVTPGMAAGTATIDAFVIDPATGDIPGLEDVAGGRTPLLLDHINRQIATTQHDDWSVSCDDSSLTLNSPLGLSELRTWMPTATGVRVWFDENQVLPGAAGIVTFLVPWDDLDGSGASIPNPCASQSIDVDGASIPDHPIARLCSQGTGQPSLVPGKADAATTLLWQGILAQLGYAVGPVDGQYGPVTQRATRQLQRDLGIVVDALVGPQTWTSVYESVCVGD